MSALAPAVFRHLPRHIYKLAHALDENYARPSALTLQTQSLLLFQETEVIKWRWASYSCATSPWRLSFRILHWSEGMLSPFIPGFTSPSFCRDTSNVTQSWGFSQSCVIWWKYRLPWLSPSFATKLLLDTTALPFQRQCFTTLSTCTYYVLGISSSAGVAQRYRVYC